MSPALRLIVLFVPLAAENMSLLATYTKPSSSSLVWISSPLTITLHEWLLSLLKRRATKMGSRLSGPSTTRRNIVRNILVYTPARSYSPPYSPRNC
ncbi:hypothetical protein DSO57_1036449 [Entomophthora muscae]|uniref:Uncharacterized protein n=1 Tax=Entomophthora muscae TaxID=34485 RepID=A0ACC2SNM6_9FUNG|nr:hypothetical protein DSO57_1036449 [Entomophthora muscae]